MVKCIWEKWNAKVRNHNLRDSKNEMNRKVLNFVEINKKEWLEISTTQVMNGSIHGCHVY